MRTIKTLLFLVYLVLLAGCSTQARFAKRATWKDEFSGKGSPNATIWARSVTTPGDQLSGYCDSDSNAYVKNGYLHLRVYNTGDNAFPYKAGRVIVNEGYQFKKGKLVVRAKAPLSAGLWPAIWLNGPTTTKGYFAELDLMEHVPAMGDSCYEAAYHLWGNVGGKMDNHINYGQIVPINVGEWHIYTLEITDDRIIMKVDDDVMYDIYKGKYGEEWPEDQDYVLRLAMAYGGYGAMEKGIDDTALPAEFLIDYVRFYKLKE